MTIAPELMTPPQEIRVNPVRDRASWEAMRQEAQANPGLFHGNIAKRECHWYDPKLNAWLRWNDDEQQWMARSHETGAKLPSPAYGPEHEPWQQAFDDSDAPFYRWFAGGMTNACFNEVDRHVLMGFGDEVAYWFEGDRWDQSKNNGRGGPVVSYPVTRKKLLLEVVKAARVLQNLGLKQGDRIALNLPNIMEQVYYTEAAKRLGIIYTPVFGGFSDKTLSDRIHNAGARVVITSDGGYRNAQIVAYKEIYTDKALDNFVPIETVNAIVESRLQELGVENHLADAIKNAVREAIKSEITVERADVMRAAGLALAADEFRGLDTAYKSRIRTAIALGLVEAPERVETVIVVKHTRQPDINWRSRDQWSHDLLATATGQIMEAARQAGHKVSSEEELLGLPDEEFVAALWATNKPVPVEADYPLFFIYTSGSTGKPKGVVHTHGGYVSGVAYTVKVAFDALPGDVIFVVADPGWITGQSYMLCATLAARLTGVIIEGSPVFPSAGRYASIIERYKVSIFKAGVTFLKAIMTDPQNVADVRHYEMNSLRVATFCAEPCSPSVQQFGMGLMTPQYINSYWATEHGGIVWTHFFGNRDFPLRPDAHTYPLPWIMGDVWLPDEQAGEAEAGKPTKYRPAEQEEKGEIVITAPYPYLARTIWGDGANVGQPGWKGDIKRYAETYWGKWADTWAYTQGDFAMKYEDGSFSLHGRSDDVINVSGHRMGTEEIEGALLRDKQVNPDSPVGNVIVVGAPHREKGLTPVAFVLTVPGRRLSVEDQRRLTETVKNEKGSTAIPSDYIEVSAFPETRSGKYMRRFLKNIINGEDLGDTTTLKNPESLVEIRRKIEDWKRKQAREEEQKIFEVYRYFRIQYNEVLPGAKVATVMITNPPVNALNERSLDELITVVDHLSRRDDVKVVIFTGQGTKSFVAGADIKQLLEEMNTYEDAIALPNNAHLAFRKIETMNKPCIAAINGVALGGGLEFALACHVRIAESTASFGQPEINLNMLPGYGGTQRLVRLLNAGSGGVNELTVAIQMILGGRAIDVDDAVELGLVMEVEEGEDVLSKASEWAREYIDSGHPGPTMTELYQLWNTRQQEMAQWEQPAEFPAYVLQRPEIVGILQQGEHAGRKKAMERAIEAIRYGWENGFSKGLQHEADLFAQAVIDPEGGKRGIQAFLDKKSAALPVRDVFAYPPEVEQEMLKKGALLPSNAAFFPGFTPIPDFQYAVGAVKDPATGEAVHGDPIEAEKKIIIPVQRPGPNQALLYMLTSEINFNDIWAITGIPVSQFEGRERDWHITGSGGTALVAAVGGELKREGRVKVGDLVVVYSGESEILSPTMGNDPMFSEFHIQGYDGTDGSHQQFLLVQGPQLHVKPADLTLEAAGSYILNLGTVYRALYTTLKIEPGRTLYVEGAATGTGMETAKAAARNGLKVTGLVSSPERAEYVKSLGAVAAINRKEYRDIWTRIPRDKGQWAAWEAAGQQMLDDYRAQSGKLADYAVCHAGEHSFPRAFQMLEQGGTLTFFGASTGYHFTFMGKAGKASAHEMMQRARLRAGEAIMLYYGTPDAVDESGIVDTLGLEAIEAARQMGGRCVVVTYTDAQREFVQSLGYGDLVKGVVSIQSIKRRVGDEFDWPMLDGGMPELPDPKTEIEPFKEAVRLFNDRIFKPIGAAVGAFLRTLDNPRGYPDLVFERAGHDALSVSSALVKPYTGRIVYAEEMLSQRYSFYAPQVWMRQRRIYMPTANIWGTHLCNAYEVTLMNDQIDAGLLEVTDPLVVPFEELADAHQAIWENRHAAGNYVANHALPLMGLKTKEELFEAWAAQQS